ncbi:hypothetical protein [Tessaracoccus flavus]|nr:hypothetical protein [Tessaracoccus flavus]
MADSAASPLVIQHLFQLIRNLVQEDLEAGLLEGKWPQPGSITTRVLP